MYTLEIPHLPPSLNDFYSGMHYRKRVEIVEEWHGLFWAALADARVPKPLKFPITIHVTQFCKGVPRDADNCVIAAKFLADTLVERHYLPDDGPNYVSTVILTSKQGNENKCVIQIL